ncbi:MAG: Flp pilus assembly protein CpaB [Planctomycetota bacterium]|nr:MAG: Flp pilus assembly protein CpaB [Planctomycetota bacterium]REJ97502.1 MAG: Flp pilus assembly protein CpaB [Planctomycetota bacterium]REK20946.1 MAG: Flp pilus assembly protein CpaB [Planctomycetota bacterium]REK37272.1 MAG: Flp pilus assembly protein CpaB [Planctomycetota bacterium]
MLMLVVVGLLVAGYVAKTLLARDEAPPEDPILTIPMALSDLEPGTVITDAHIALGRMRESHMTPETIRSDRVVVGRVVKQPITAARAILTTDLYPPGEFPPLELGENMRAVSIALGDGSSAVDGLIRPQEFVDVHFTPASYRDQERTGGMTMTLFKGVKVLAVNRSTSGASPAARGGNTVTLELSEEQANIIILARDKGDLTLTYTPEGKGDGGVAVSRSDRATLDEILGLDPIPAAERPFASEIFYGSGRTVLEFQNRRRIDNGSRDSESGREPPQTIDGETGALDSELPAGGPSA